ncbi:MAG: translation elongation factor Ts [Mycoplasmoidaceae bacterium]|nr:MAG: translation elongation factor Ts [Mycoplasmoidaceae bacterium]
MAIDIKLVKQLRDMTQAGVTDAMKALNENNGNIDKAVQWLREKGIAKAAKKAGNIAAEGIATVLIKEDAAVIIELNCETDFVATNEGFLNLIDMIALTLIESGENDIEKALKLKLSNKMTIEQACTDLTAKIGEKIALRRYEIVGKKKNQSFASYQHTNKRIAVLLTTDKSVDPVVAKDIAMHAAAMAPKYLNSDQVDKKWLDSETKIIKEQMASDPKFSAMFKDSKMEGRVTGIISGKINKLLSEVTLEAQPFVKDPSKTVKQYVNAAGADVIKYVRYQVGEGIEKKVVDFAAEVAAQMKK